MVHLKKVPKMSNLDPRSHSSCSSFWVPAMQVEPRAFAYCEVSSIILCKLIMPLASEAYTVVLGVELKIVILKRSRVYNLG